MLEVEKEGGQNPEELDEATQEVLAEMEKEGHEIDQPAKSEEKPEVKEDPKPTPKEEKPEEPKPKDSEKPEAEKPKEEEPETPRKPRSVKMVPAWKLEIEKQKGEKLAADLEKARNAPPAPAPNVPEAPKPSTQKLDSAIKKWADKTGVDEADVRELTNAILDGFKPQTELPKEILDQLADLKKFKDTQENSFNEASEMAEYGKEFERDILPLVKAKYPDVSDAKIGELKAKLATIAFTEEYAKLPLKKIFLAEQDGFSDVLPAESKPSAEPGRGGAGRNEAAIAPIDYDDPNLDISKLTDAQLDEFNTHQLARENK